MDRYDRKYTNFGIKIPFKLETVFNHDEHNLRASEVSETLSGVTNGNRRYIKSVKPFLKRSNHWRLTLTRFKREPCTLVMV